MLKPLFDKGQNVLIRGKNKIGTVNSVIQNQHGVAYKVTVEGRTMVYREKFLEAYHDTEQEIFEEIMAGDYHGSDDYHLFQTWYRLKRPIEGNLYSYLASRTIFNPYQFKPVLKFIAPGSEERLFIADEVGVGKTIETGIILTELIGRGRLDRKSPVLIVCPGVLSPKWKAEMEHRFNLRFTLHDGRSFRNYVRQILSSGVSDSESWAVIGLELIRQRENVDLLERLASKRESAHWAMTVIDESHHMRNAETESNVVGNLLSVLSETMIMLSGTPLNLRDEDLFQQLHILNPAMFPDAQTFSALLGPIKAINRCRRLLAERSTAVYRDVLDELNQLNASPIGAGNLWTHPTLQRLVVSLNSGSPLTSSEIAQYDRFFTSLSPLDQTFTRTLKREAIDHRVTREVVKVPVKLSEKEMEIHEGIIRAVEKAFLDRGGDPRVLGFISNMPRRMVSSCIPAMKSYIDWALENDQVLLDDGSSNDPNDDGDLPKVAMTDETRRLFGALREQVRLLGPIDTKYDQYSHLIRSLRDTLDNPQIVTFSFFVRTLKYLKSRLEDEGYRVGLICGEVPNVSDGTVPGRYDIIRSFENKELDILLSSEVGGEGLDFQFCQAIVNYDLPYNPMKVEQRIGRIDRFGQTADKIVAASMYIAETVDERIYQLLYERIRLVEDSVGMMEPILGSALVDLQRDIVSGRLSPEQLNERMGEIEIAIEHAKLEMERFESQRLELMADDFLASPLHAMQQTNNFVAPSDAVRLTGLCLNRWDGCSFDAVDSDRGVIRLSKAVVQRLEQFVRTPGSEGSGPELAPLVQPRMSGIPVIFNGSLADEYRDHVFIPPSGFWVRFLIRELEAAEQVFRVFQLRSSTLMEFGLTPGRYAVPLFEVQLEGMHVELTMAAVPVDLDSSRPVPCDFETLSRALSRDSGDTTLGFAEKDLDWNHIVEAGRACLTDAVDAKVENLRIENAYRIDARIESLKRGSSVRIERLRRRMQAHIESQGAQNKEPSREFQRLMEAQITAEEQRTNAKILNLSSQRDVSYSIALIGVVVCEVGEETSM